jgi:hypothetical protein
MPGFDPQKTRRRLIGLAERIVDYLRDMAGESDEDVERIAERLAAEAAEVSDKAVRDLAFQRRVCEALSAEIGATPKPIAWSPGAITYSIQGKTFRRKFEKSDNAIRFDKAEEIRTAESAIERWAAEATKSGLIKIISPGHGSSGYWSPEVLARDGARAFPAGTHMHINHPSESEAFDRPERDLNTLAGVLETAAQWMDNGPRGPGLYARAKVNERMAKIAEDFGEYIGVSVRARVSERDGQIMELLASPFNTVDFVTVPGAGGRIVEAFEAAGRGPATKREKEEYEMSESEIRSIVAEALKPLTEAVAGLAKDSADARRVAEAAARRAEENEVREAARAVAAKSTLPEAAQARAVEAVAANAPRTADGLIDHERLAVVAEAAVKREAEYIASVAGNGSVASFGGAKGDGDDEAAILKEAAKLYVEAGYSPEMAAKMVGVSAS